MKLASAIVPKRFFEKTGAGKSGSCLPKRHLMMLPGNNKDVDEFDIDFDDFIPDWTNNDALQSIHVLDPSRPSVGSTHGDGSDARPEATSPPHRHFFLIDGNVLFAGKLLAAETQNVDIDDEIIIPETPINWPIILNFICLCPCSPSLTQ